MDKVLTMNNFALVKGGPDEANAKKALAMMTNTEMLAGSAKYII